MAECYRGSTRASTPTIVTRSINARDVLPFPDADLKHSVRQKGIAVRLSVIAFVAAMGAAALCHAQTPDMAARLVAGCTSDSAFGVPFGERSDRMFTTPPNVAPYRATTALRRTPNSRQLHLAEVVVELPDDAAASALVADGERVAIASGRFPQRELIEDGETVTLTAADNSVRLEIGVLGRGAYFTCVKPALQDLALAEFAGRVRVERPTPPSLPLPPRPAANVCQDANARRGFVTSFESALQTPMEYAGALSAYSSTLQQWYGQQLKDRSNFSADDEAALALRTLQDPAFAEEMEAGLRNFTAFMQSLSAFSDARDANNEPLACSRALDVLARVDEMSASSQRQWARIEALYREEATRRGVTLD